MPSRSEPSAAHSMIGGEEIRLLPGRAAFRERTGELLVSDVHLGKDETFARSGRPLPQCETAEELRKLSSLLSTSGATRLTVLGDLTHHHLDDTSKTLALLRTWLTDHAAFTPRLVLGNHDRHARTQLDTLPLEIVPEPFECEGLSYRHEPPVDSDTQRAWLAGHVHPGVVLSVANDRLRVPVFWSKAGGGLVLPAFGDFTGLQIIRPLRGETVFAAGDDAVVALPSKLITR